MTTPYRLFIPECRKIIGIASGCINQNFDPSSLQTVVKRCVGLTYNVINVVACLNKATDYKHNIEMISTISKIFPNGSLYSLEMNPSSPSSLMKEMITNSKLLNIKSISIKENQDFNIPLIEEKNTDIDILCCDCIPQTLINCLESKCNRPKFIIYLSSNEFNNIDVKLSQNRYKILQVYRNTTIYINDDVKEPPLESLFSETSSTPLNINNYQSISNSPKNSANPKELKELKESVNPKNSERVLMSVHEIEKKVTFLTSIYPESDLRNSHQIRAISSWIKHGINVVSVNLPSEVTIFKSKIYLGLYDKVQFISAQYSACLFTSKRSPPFNLMMKAASEVLKIHSDHMIAIVNSDMYLHFSSPVHKFACMMGWRNLLRDNSVVIFNRREVSAEKNPEKDQGYLSDRLYGAIMFSSPKDTDEDLSSENIPLRMGNPWLKTILVQSLIKSNLNIGTIYYETPFIHVSHERRWNPVDDYYGLLAFINMFPEIFARVNNDNRLIRDYVAQSLRQINTVTSTPDYHDEEYDISDETENSAVGECKDVREYKNSDKKLDWVMITSIQPSQVRNDLYTIKSWINSGCKVISLNNTIDFKINSTDPELKDVSFIQFDDSTDKYPSLDKVLTVASEYKGSMIFLAPSSTGLWFLSKNHQEYIQSKIETLLTRKVNRMDFLIELQWEYESPTDEKILHGSGGKENDINYSVMIFKEVPSVPKNDFRFGYNWVDYFISWSLVESGKKVKILRDNICSYFKNSNNMSWNEYAEKIKNMYPHLYALVGNSYSKMGDLMRDEIRYYSFVERRKTEKSQLVPEPEIKSKITYTEWEKTHPIKKLNVDSNPRISLPDDFLKLYLDVVTEHKSDLSDIMNLIVKIPEKERVYQILDRLNKVGSLRRILLGIKSKDINEIYNRLLYAESI